MNLQLPKVISKDLARQVIGELMNRGHKITGNYDNSYYLDMDQVLAILFPDD